MTKTQKFLYFQKLYRILPPPTKLRISLNLRTTAQVEIAAWYPKKMEKHFRHCDNTARWNSNPKHQVGGWGGYPVKKSKIVGVRS